jgi:hypothetical protein
MIGFVQRWAIAPVLTGSAETVDKQSLINEIERAFSGVLLEGGIGIHEANVIDDYGDEDQRRQARLGDSKSWVGWQDIPDDTLRRHYTTFCFVDSKGFKYLIPAYMRFVLRNYEEDGSASIDSTIYALAPDNYNFDGFAELLTLQQKRAIKKFLEFLILDVGDDLVDASAASTAYESYWCQF